MIQTGWGGVVITRHEHPRVEKYLVVRRGGYLALETHEQKDERLEVKEGAGLILWRPPNEASLTVEVVRPTAQFHFEPGMEHCLIGTEDLLVFERSIDPKGMDQDLIFIYEPDALARLPNNAHRLLCLRRNPLGLFAVRATRRRRAFQRHRASRAIRCLRPRSFPASAGTRLGDEILQVAQDKGVDTRVCRRAPGSDSPPGPCSSPWMRAETRPTNSCNRRPGTRSAFPREALEAVSKSRALIYGSLAGRSPYNLDQLARLLEVKGPLKFFDVNLRPPFADPKLVMELAKRADVLKLNDGEVGQLASWLQTGEIKPDTPRTMEAVIAPLVLRSPKPRAPRAFASRWLKKARLCGIAAIL